MATAEHMDYQEIGKNVKSARQRSGITQSELAEIVESSPAHISHIERAQTKVSLPLLIRIANALSVDANTLFGRNLEKNHCSDYGDDFNNLLKSVSAAQRKQCIEICRTAIKYGEWFHNH